MKESKKLVFVSTGGIRDKSGAETAAMYLKHGIMAAELSGGRYATGHLSKLKKLSSKLRLQIHNYFPPPKEPFVLNLASMDKNIAERSFQHVRKAMRWAVEVDRPVYSFHAGFLVDPQVGELGKSIQKCKLNDRTSALHQFGEKVLSLAEHARHAGVTLLIENNVLSQANMESFGEDPLLFTRADEIIGFMNEMPDNVGLLLDVAHMKVSANTLGFDPVEAHQKVSNFIRGYHLSDNDGLSDSNNIVTENSWFWDVIRPEVGNYTLEVYGLTPVELVEQHDLVMTKLA